MLFGFVLLFAYSLAVWLVFFKFRWLKFSITWGVVSAFVGAHLLIIFLIGLRFVTPYSTEAIMIQHTIQLVPRLSEPTLLTEVLALRPGFCGLLAALVVTHGGFEFLDVLG